MGLLRARGTITFCIDLGIEDWAALSGDSLGDGCDNQGSGTVGRLCGDKALQKC